MSAASDPVALDNLVVFTGVSGLGRRSRWQPVGLW